MTAFKSKGSMRLSGKSAKTWAKKIKADQKAPKSGKPASK